MGRWLLFVTLFFSITVAAHDPFCVAVQVGVELLFFRPSRCGLEYAVSDARAYVPPNDHVPTDSTEQWGPEGKIETVNPDYHFGLRVMAAYPSESHCYDLRAQYTRLYTTDMRRSRPSPECGAIWAVDVNGSNALNINAPLIQVILFNPSCNQELPFETYAEALAKTKFQYDAADLQIGFPFNQCNTLSFRAFAGAHFAAIDNFLDLEYRGTLHPGVTEPPFTSSSLFSHVRRKGKSWGVGPRVGLDIYYSLPCGFGLTGRAAAAIVTGCREAKYFQFYQTTSTQESLQKLEERTSDLYTTCEILVTPELDVRGGFNFTFCCQGVILWVELGYELITYLDMVPLGIRLRQDRSVLAQDCATFTLDGAYLSLRGQF